MTASASATAEAAVRTSLRKHAPFDALDDADFERIVQSSELRHYASNQTILGPETTRPLHCFIITAGFVRGERPSAAAERDTWELAGGEMFPLAALLARRGVTSLYQAAGDATCLALPAPVFYELVEASTVFRDFCNRRLGHLLDISRARLQAAYAAETASRAGFAAPLRDLVRRKPIVVAPNTPLGSALEIMEYERIGALPVVDENRRPIGIFTRQDVVGRVLLAGRGLDTPIHEVMSHPVYVLSADATTADAALLAARHGVRHIVVVDDQGRIAGVMSDRDLFALARPSAREIHSTIRRAPDIATLAQCAADVRALSHALVTQGVGSAPLTRMISNLNDQLTGRVLDVVAREFDLGDLTLCWIGMGSEGRGEQTIATDQDNGLIFADSGAGRDPAAARERLLPFAGAVNAALDRCGYPLCRGGVMARNPRWCRSLPEWQAAFARWIDRGDPESLLASSISFDFRALWGNASLAAELRIDVATRAHANRRFQKQMAEEALRHRPPLNWRGEVDPHPGAAGEQGIDLKLEGSTPFVDAARVFALASGATATNTVERLAAAAKPLNLPDDEIRAWADAFEFLQLLRLRAQHRRTSADRADANPNFVALRDLSALDRRILREALRLARQLQRRLELDIAPA